MPETNDDAAKDVPGYCATRNGPGGRWKESQPELIPGTTAAVTGSRRALCADIEQATGGRRQQALTFRAKTSGRRWSIRATEKAPHCPRRASQALGLRHRRRVHVLVLSPKLLAGGFAVRTPLGLGSRAPRTARTGSSRSASICTINLVEWGSVSSRITCADKIAAASLRRAGRASRVRKQNV